MRLLDDLIAQRDFHLREAAKCAEAIAEIDAKADDAINQMVKQGTGLIGHPRKPRKPRRPGVTH